LSNRIIDLEEVPLTNWFDSESDFPEISSVNSTLELGVNVSSPSANPHHEQALGTEDSNAAGSVSNRGNLMGHAPFEETESNKRVNLLDTQSIHLLKASPHHLFRATVVGPSVEEER